MSKHTKPTKLVISAVTKKKHTKPTGHSIEVMLPHELAVNWANTIGSRIEAIKAETGASSMKDMGAVMGELKARHGAVLDGKLASTLVKAALS